MATDIVTPAVREAAGGDPRVTLSLELGALLEGGSLTGPFGVGDNGHSYGPFQINLPFHPGVTAAQAVDPRFAASYMVAAYQAAVAQIPDSLWQSNPEQAAEHAAFIAERPAQDYFVARGKNTVDTAYANAVGALGGSNNGGGDSGGNVLGDIVSGSIGSAVGGIVNPVGTTLDSLGISNPLDALNPANWLEDAIKAFITNGFVLRATLMAAGLIILFIGLSQISKGDQTPTQTAGSGAETVRVKVVQGGSNVRGKAKARSQAKSDAKDKAKADAETAGEDAA